MARRVHMFVTGRVQGVFFRQALKVTAKKNGVLGWVRNLEDGRVEAVLEGTDADVGRVVAWAVEGPANARVEDVRISRQAHTGEFSKFDVLY